jgi:hypothetical protein
MVHGQILKTDADFHNAILLGIAVSITQDDEQMGSGHIIDQSKYTVKTIDCNYFKDACVFTVFSAVIKNRSS